MWQLLITLGAGAPHFPDGASVLLAASRRGRRDDLPQISTCAGEGVCKWGLWEGIRRSGWGPYDEFGSLYKGLWEPPAPASVQGPGQTKPGRARRRPVRGTGELQCVRTQRGRAQQEPPWGGHSKTQSGRIRGGPGMGRTQRGRSEDPARPWHRTAQRGSTRRDTAWEDLARPVKGHLVRWKRGSTCKTQSWRTWLSSRWDDQRDPAREGRTQRAHVQPRTENTEHSPCGQDAPPGPRGANVRCVRCHPCVAVVPTLSMETVPALLTLADTQPPRAAQPWPRGPAPARPVRTDPPLEAENLRLNSPRWTQPGSHLCKPLASPGTVSVPGIFPAPPQVIARARTRGFPGGPPAGLRSARLELGAACGGC